MSRRCWLVLLLLCLLGAQARAFAPVVPGTPLVFPADHGAHPDFRTEWWYVTGWLTLESGSAEIGFQLTFFRVRTGRGEDNPSRFAPRQILLAHAAIADPRAGRLWHEERRAREGFAWAQASRATTDVRIGDWSLALEGDTYRARVRGRQSGFDLALRSTQPLLLQGEAGFSQKAPARRHASYYYSRPHLSVTGTVVRDGRPVAVRGKAWLDHEWSSELMPEGAVGWDWVGVNLEDGGALMAFRMRDAAGAAIWSQAVQRRADGSIRRYGSREVEFIAQRRWRSPRTAAEYPVALRLRLPDMELDIEPLMDDQELDARGSTGNVYWEGAVRAFAGGSAIGRGYLELTGYAKRLRL